MQYNLYSFNKYLLNLHVGRVMLRYAVGCDYIGYLWPRFRRNLYRAMRATGKNPLLIIYEARDRFIEDSSKRKIPRFII